MPAAKTAELWADTGFGHKIKVSGLIALDPICVVVVELHPYPEQTPTAGPSFMTQSPPTVSDLARAGHGRHA